MIEQDYKQYEHPDILLFPKEFNMLRKKLFEEFPTLWGIVGGMMLHDHDSFIEYMNSATGVNVTAGTGIDVSCLIWIQALDDMKRANKSGIMLPSGNQIMLVNKERN